MKSGVANCEIDLFQLWKYAKINMFGIFCLNIIYLNIFLCKDW